MSDDRQFAPATLRNRDFILDVLRDVLPTTGDILEVASGSGEHIVHFARNFPALVFQPSDPEPDALLSVAAWVKATRVTNVRKPILLDASQSVWPIIHPHGELPKKLYAESFSRTDSHRLKYFWQSSTKYS